MRELSSAEKSAIKSLEKGIAPLRKKREKLEEKISNLLLERTQIDTEINKVEDLITKFIGEPYQVEEDTPVMSENPDVENMEVVEATFAPLNIE